MNEEMDKDIYPKKMNEEERKKWLAEEEKEKKRMARQRGIVMTFWACIVAAVLVYVGYSTGHDIGYDEGYRGGEKWGYKSGHEEGYRQAMVEETQDYEEGYELGFYTGYDYGFFKGAVRTTDKLIPLLPKEVEMHWRLLRPRVWLAERLAENELMQLGIDLTSLEEPEPIPDFYGGETLPEVSPETKLAHLEGLMEELLQEDEPDPKLLDSMTAEDVEWALASVQFLLETGFPYPYDMIYGSDEEQQKEMEESNQKAREALLRAKERLLKMRERLLRKGATSGG